MSAPPVRYAKTANDLSIAYTLSGDGPHNIVIVWGTMSHVEMMWDDPPLARFFERLGSFARLVQFDKRGTGLSDKVVGTPTLEERMDDVRAVMDEVGMEQAVVMGESEGGPMSILFAATYPQRTTALVLYGALCKAISTDDFPWAVDEATFDAFTEYTAQNWGKGESMSQLFAPSRDSADAQAFGARFERNALSPGAFRDLFRCLKDIDIRPALPLVSSPTLVVHRSGDRVISVNQGRYLAEHIEGARFIELPGTDHYIGGGDSDPIADEIEEFVTGVRPAVQPDRVLATVLFTDIVGSTDLASRLGDRAWRDVLERHDAIVTREVTRHGGHPVKHTGDGAVATFDGPARGVRCACSIRDGMKGLDLHIRAGLHTGEIELSGADVRGIAVHIGARVSALAGPDEVLVSRTVTDLVAGSGLAFDEKGEYELKGVPGRWPIFAVV